MRKKRAKLVAGSLCGILAMTSPIQSIATTAISHVADGISYTDYAGSGREGYSVAKADASALSGDTLVIPESVNGKDVIHLGSNFLSGSGARQVDVGKNIIGMNADAFFEAKDLEKITSSSRAFAVSDNDPALYTYQHSLLLDYPSAASNGGDYAVHEATKAVYSMDNAAFGKLDLVNADTLAKHALAGTTVDELAVADNMRTTTGSGSVRLTLPGLHAGEFSLTGAGSGSYLRTDGQSLSTSDGTLIKLASGVTGVDWGAYQEIDTDAFDSMAQYWDLSASIPEGLKKDKVFHFYNQNNGVFIVNDQTAFCYNSDKHIPDKVTDSADFSSIIDGANYDKVSAVMFVGVPYDGTGLFEKTFGLSYEEAVQDAQMSRNGNAALNAVSSMIWELVDGRPSDVIDGTGSTSYFTEANVQAYMEGLREAAANPGNYTFSPAFEIEGGTLTFREQEDGIFLSDPFKVSAVDGNGVKNDSYKIQMTLSGEGFGIYGDSSMSFSTGTEIRLTSQKKPEGQPLSFTYEKGSLTYYAPGGAGEQNLLVSGKKTENTAIQYAFEVKPVKEELVISKRAVGGSEELAGASLKVTDANGAVVDEWVSGSEPHTMDMPEDGVYTLTEITAPDGFQVAESITFTVEGGKVVDGMVIMYDAPEARKITVSKKDITTSEELPGASLTVTDSNGNVVDEWVSTDTPHVIEDLADGVYTLTEKTAPEGYEVAENVTFTVTDGKAEEGTVVMYDKPVEKEVPSFSISKKDMATGEELPGASLKITDKDGNTVEEWVSTDEPHEVKGLEDGTYTLTEVTAPEGYEVAENITFVVKDGKVEGDKIVMYDKPEEKEEPSFSVSKRDAATGEELPGASLKITDKDGNTVEEWVSTDKPHEVKGLEDGTYTLTEVTAPDGYEVAEQITFVVKDGKVEGNKVVMYDEPEKKDNTPSEPDKPVNTPSEPDKPDTPDKPDKPDTPDKPDKSDKPEGSFYISKRDAANSNELPGAKLKVTDASGNTVEEWTSENTPHKISGLADGTYTLTEITAPYGYDIAESITFTVKDGKVEGGTVVMYDKLLPGKPSGSGGGGGHSSGGGGNHSGGDTTHGPGVETKTLETTPTPTPTPQPTPESTPAPSSLPKTNDQPTSTLVFWAAALTLAGLLADKKKYLATGNMA